MVNLDYALWVVAILLAVLALLALTGVIDPGIFGGSQR